MFDSDIAPELRNALQAEFEAGLIEKDDARWGGDGEFLKKSEEGIYKYNGTELLWYNFLQVKRSWPEDFELENGNYECRCAACTNMFVGYTRRSCCKLCAEAIAAGNKPRFSDPKQVILVRKDLETSPGKLAAQVAHASVSCLMSLGHWNVGDQASNYVMQFSIEINDNERDNAILNWMTKSFPKITLQVLRTRLSYGSIMSSLKTPACRRLSSPMREEPSSMVFLLRPALASVRHRGMPSMPSPRS